MAAQQTKLQTTQVQARYQLPVARVRATTTCHLLRLDLVLYPLSYPCGDRSLIHWCSQSSSVFVYNTRGERFDASSAMLPAFVRAEQDNGLVPYLRAQPMLHPYSSTPVQNVQEATWPLLQTRNRTLIPILSKGMGLPVPDVKFNVRSSNGIMYTATTRISDVVRCT